MTLDKVTRGCEVEILSIPSSDIKSQAIRLGLFEGARLICSEKLPNGPVILQNRIQEIAVGRRLAQKIHVQPTSKNNR